MANASPKIVLGMPFLPLSSADVDFFGRELRWRTYTTKEALPTTRRVELVGKKEFAAIVLDPERSTRRITFCCAPQFLLARCSPFL